MVEIRVTQQVAEVCLSVGFILGAVAGFVAQTLWRDSKTGRREP